MHLVGTLMAELLALPPIFPFIAGCLGIMSLLVVFFGTGEKAAFYNGTKLGTFRNYGYRAVVITFMLAVHAAPFAVALSISQHLTQAISTGMSGNALGAAVHLGMVVGGFAWSTLWWLISGIGVTAGYHRISTHQGCELPSWLRAMFYCAGQTAGQQSVVMWRRIHEYHHQESDEEWDVHSRLFRYGKAITNKFFGWRHAHMGWVITFLPKKLTDTFPESIQDLERRDPLAKQISRFYGLCVGLPLILAFSVGRWELLAWHLTGLCVTYHATWSVNSWAHGTEKESIAGDASRNVFGIFAFLSHGETIHGNHHEYPPGAIPDNAETLRHDRTARLLLWLQKRGLVRDIKVHRPRNPEARPRGQRDRAREHASV